MFSRGRSIPVPSFHINWITYQIHSWCHAGNAQMTHGLWCRASFFLNISLCCHFWVTIRGFITSIFPWACRGFIFQSHTRKSCCQLWFHPSAFRSHTKKKGQSLNQALSILEITLKATIPCHSTDGTCAPSYSYQNQLSLEMATH